MTTDFGALSGELILPAGTLFSKVELAGNLDITLPSLSDGQFLIIEVTQPVAESYEVDFLNAVGFGGSPVVLDSDTSRRFGFWGFDGEIVRNTTVD